MTHATGWREILITGRVRQSGLSNLMITTFTVMVGLFLSAITSATLLPGTSEAALAALVASGDHAVWGLVAVATAGNVLGSTVNWALGLYVDRFKNRRWFPITPDALDRASHWFGKYGLWSLLLAWLPVIGDPLTLLAGVMRVRFVPFLILVTIGKAARYTLIAGGATWIASIISN